MVETKGEPIPTVSKRGRKSSASLAVVPIDVAQQRPKPPAGLSAEEKRVWNTIVTRCRAGWFHTSESLLEAYCHAVAHERALGAMAAEAGASDPRYPELLKMQRAEAMLAGNLATKLRLTPRSSIDKNITRLTVAPLSPWPWEDQVEDDEPPAA
jgi:phage terminase small subunit